MNKGIRLKDLPLAVQQQLRGQKPAKRRIPSPQSEPCETLALHIRSSKIVPPPEREYRFASRRWRADFAWPPQRLLVEVEGGSWLPDGGGRHNRGAGFQSDCEKYLDAFEAGFYVVRFTTRMVKDGTALQALERFFQKLLPQRLSSLTDRSPSFTIEL